MTEAWDFIGKQLSLNVVSTVLISCIFINYHNDIMGEGVYREYLSHWKVLSKNCSSSKLLIAKVAKVFCDLLIFLRVYFCEHISHDKLLKSMLS